MNLYGDKTLHLKVIIMYNIQLFNLFMLLSDFQVR